MEAHGEGSLANKTVEKHCPIYSGPIYLSSQTPRFPAWVGGVAIEQGNGRKLRIFLGGQSDEFSS